MTDQTPPASPEPQIPGPSPSDSQVPGDAAPPPQAAQTPAAPAEHGHHPPKPRLTIGIFLRQAIVRLYAAGLAALILVVCLSAIVYLFRYVFMPAQLPAQFTGSEGTLDAEALRQTNAPGITADAKRAAPSHYHKVDRWFQTDPLNGCTVSGCHSPLPHMRKVDPATGKDDPRTAIAAFANLHVTFLDCMICHQKPDANLPEVKWFSVASYSPQGVPASLRLMDLLEKADSGNAKKTEPAIIGWLLELERMKAASPEMLDLLKQLQTSAPGSKRWREEIRKLADSLKTSSASRPTTPAMEADIIKRRQWLQKLLDNVIQYDPKNVHGGIVSLLKEMLKSAGEQKFMSELLVQIESSQPDSPLWQKSVKQLMVEVPRHTRGGYAAKMARSDATAATKLADKTQSYLKAAPNSPEQASAKAALHHDVLRSPNACLQCHTAEKPTLDFVKLGYPASRSKALHDLVLGSMARSIQSGTPFQLPKVEGQ